MNFTRYVRQASEVMANVPTPSLAAMLDNFHPTTQAERYAHSALSLTLGKRYAVHAQGMDCRDLAQALAAIADYRLQLPESAKARRESYADALVRRCPEARAAEQAWECIEDEESEEFERGPVVMMVAAALH